MKEGMILNPHTAVLVVEDARNTRQMICHILYALGLKNVEEATDGSTALEKLEQRRADLIILDWNLPQMSGIVFLRAIRRDARLKEIPVIMVTGKTEKEAVKEAIQAGVNDYIVKPFSIETFENKIKKIFGV